MKRIAMILLAGLACTGLLAAQTAGTWSAETLRGNLALVDGQIAIQTQDTVYYIPGLGRLTGFIDGLKEGAAVVLEGQSYNVGTTTDAGLAKKIFQVSKLTIGSRTWDNLNTAGHHNGRMDRAMMPGMPAMPGLPAPGTQPRQGRSR